MVVSTGWADWAGSGDLAGHGHWIPNQGMMGHPGAIRMILLYEESCNMTALPNMADSGKVYAS